jgi:hypothetical protein
MVVLLLHDHVDDASVPFLLKWRLRRPVHPFEADAPNALQPVFAQVVAG